MVGGHGSISVVVVSALSCDNEEKIVGHKCVHFYDDWGVLGKYDQQHFDVL